MDVTPILEDLNDAQRQAVTAPAKPTLVIAGAGSGKTRVLVHRAAWLIDVDGISPHSLLAVTFTNKAAAEMRHRIEALLNVPVQHLWIGTFHGLAHRMLRRHWREAKLPQNFQIIDSDDQLRLLKRLLKNLEVDDSRWVPKEIQWFINAQKDEGLRPQHLDDEGDPNRRQMISLYQSYEEICQRGGLVDFAELLLRAHELLRDNEELLSHYRRRFQHLLVDEFQDTNAIQYAWLRLLAGSDGVPFAVGDDDQSIYRWRGARVEHIHRFQKDFPGTLVVKLEQNYRSTATILNAANAVIANNASRLGKNLWTDGAEGEAIRVYSAYNERDEADFVIGRLRDWIDQGNLRADSAILYRSNAQSRVLEEGLINAGIPYRVYGGLRFFERMEIKDALAYWALLHHCADGLHLRRICNKPKRGIGAVGEQQLADMLSASGLRTADWLDTLQEGGPGPAGKLASLAQHIVELRANAQQQPDIGLGELLEKSGYLESLKAMGEIEAESRRDNIQALQDYIAIATAEGMTPIEFLDRAALLQSGERLAADKQAADNDDDALSLMSLHRAKGLEFDCVVLSGVEEGLLPHQRSLDEGPTGLSEERRLLYVGITRARDYLLLTSARMRRAFGDMMFPQPSRFIINIPETVLARNEAIPVAPSGDSSGLEIGCSVQHPTFGEGVILSVEGAGDAMRVSVNFRRAGTKRLMLKYAALKMI